ncbi:MAG: TIGR03790 family protein [Terrimicrobiaceae bacterium]
MDCCFRFSVRCLAMIAFATGLHAERDPASALVVVYNSADPSSEALANYYAKRRQIDDDRVVGLKCSEAEEISRAEYEATIAQPLREIFLRKGWWLANGERISESRIRFLALIRGMPLKIRPQEGGVVPRTDQGESIGSRDEASVDSELATLGIHQESPAGVVPNPYYRRFTPILEANVDPALLLVCRLDAPSEITVRAMIDDALAAEENGLWGWAYVDSRNIQTSGYAEGDHWLSEISREMRGQGIPVLWDKEPPLLPSGYPVTDAAVYFGWYAESICGPLADPNFRFQPGAIAVHIHSFSASTLRDPAAGWCGPLLEHGAAVTLGTVYEPYLTLTAHLDIFQNRLMEGFTFAESAFMSMGALSWMNVALGDPLYRPYAVWRRISLEKTEPTPWERYREIVRAFGGNILAAGPKLAQAAGESGNSLFLESLAADQADANDLNPALGTLDTAISIEKDPLVRFRLVLEEAGALRASGKGSAAVALILSQKGKSPGPPQMQLLEAISTQFTASPPVER